jgi:hypothetical protein
MLSTQAINGGNPMGNPSRLHVIVIKEALGY